MYVATLPSTGDDLEQGDVCLNVPILLLDGERRIVALSSKSDEFIGPDEIAGLHGRPKLAAMVPLEPYPVVVLSQSCDLAGLTADSPARILVAPILPDSDGRFAAAYARAEKDIGEAEVKRLLAQTRKPSSGAAADLVRLAKPANSALEKLWLGEMTGAFPLAESSVPGTHFPRSVCFFDNIVSLPASWGALLRGRRAYRLTPTWGAVLREHLSLWMGRFAYPGTDGSGNSAASRSGNSAASRKEKRA